MLLHELSSHVLMVQLMGRVTGSLTCLLHLLADTTASHLFLFI